MYFLRAIGHAWFEPSMNNMESSYIEDRKGGMDERDDSSEADEEESKRLEERRKEWRVDDRRCSASSSSSSSSGKVITTSSNAILNLSTLSINKSSPQFDFYGIILFYLYLSHSGFFLDI